MKENLSQSSTEPLLEYFDRLIPLNEREKGLIRTKFHSRLFRKRQFVLQEADVCTQFNIVVRGCLRTYKIALLLAICFFLQLNNLAAQVIKFEKSRLLPVNVSMSIEKLMGKEAIKVIKDSNIKNVDEPTFVKIKGLDLKNGIIEVKVLSRLLKDAPDFARGFIGIAFRINDSNTRYESIYLRPANARVDDQVRRNHSIQYYSYPDYKFDRLRKEAPEKYESYADMELNKWITMRIEIKDTQAKLFLNNNKQPSLIVIDLKHGAGSSGAIGLWVDIGTEGYFSDLKIIKQ